MSSLKSTIIYGIFTAIIIYGFGFLFLWLICTLIGKPMTDYDYSLGFIAGTFGFLVAVLGPHARKDSKIL